MGRSELIKAQLVVSLNTYNLALRDLFTQFCNRLEQDWLIRTFEVFVLFSIQESYEIRDGGNSVSLRTFSRDLGVDCDELKIWVFITFSSTFESWLDSHTRRAGWAPEINDHTGCLFDNLLEKLER